MTILPRPPSPKKPDSVGAKKQGLFGLLFKPQIGSNIGPLRESTRIFVQLVAGVFAIYKLIPKDYPGLRDPNARLSFSNIISTAWQNIRLTREGAPQVILFFAITGVMAFSAFVAVLALLSLFVGHAHAQTLNSTDFSPESSDIAQAWISYLFTGTALPSYYTNMANAVPASMGLQGALITVLAFYSDAILIIAAMILFYHLTAMVVETAHHGVVMGKRANQIWAPIRLVVAVGLLVPINSGLNSGQYIVIQMAEWGSGLASHAWDQFLTALNSYSPAAIPPNSPIITQAAADAMSMYACVTDYNDRIAMENQSLGPGVLQQINTNPMGVVTTVGGRPGTKYSFSSDDVAGQDLCGFYFIPKAPTDADPTTQNAYTKEASDYLSFIASIAPIAKQDIESVMPTDATGNATVTTVALDKKSMDAMTTYQSKLASDMAAVAANAQSQTSAAITQIQPYGWVFAGALLPMIERAQALVSNAMTAGLPITSPPAIVVPSTETAPPLMTFRGSRPQSEVTEHQDSYDVVYHLAEDMSVFTKLVNASFSQTAPSDPQCAAMMGLQDAPQGTGWGADAINYIFGRIDSMATWNGVWRSGVGKPCGAAGIGAAGLDTFQVGIDLSSPDILTQMASLGHANIDTAIDVLTAAVVANLGAAGGAAVGAAVGTGAEPGLGTFLGIFLGAAAGAALKAAAGVLIFIATIFFLCGFTLAYVLPMFAFMHFFFAVLSWVGGLIEAVIAVPLVALAHLSPEGDGLPGPAKGAYYFVFNIFLRPILSVFGLVCALLVFMIAASFLTYAYNLGVAATGGTAYGHEFVSKIIYSIIYVALMYVCGNHAFKLISHIPDRALSWMGQQGQQMPGVGSADNFERIASLAGSYVGDKGIHQVGTSAGELTQGITSGANQYKGIQDKKTSEDKALLQQAAGRDSDIDRSVQEAAHRNGVTVDEFATQPQFSSQFADIAGPRAADPQKFLDAYRNRKSDL